MRTSFYRQIDSNVSSKFKNFKDYVKRRNEAHNYFFQFMKENDLKVKNLDFYFTKFVNKFI